MRTKAAKRSIETEDRAAAAGAEATDGAVAAIPLPSPATAASRCRYELLPHSR
jgi:hypothetical protein